HGRMHMERVTEPEIMDEEMQVMAYATADFDETNGRFIELFQECFASYQPGRYVVDLGCGPGDITIRFAEAYPDCIVHGLDGSAPMLCFANDTLARKGLSTHRVQFIQGVLPDVRLPRDAYHVIISNGLLHHLHAPGVLWQTMKSHARSGTQILIRDLI